jgi:hypothetical protein
MGGSTLMSNFISNQLLAQLYAQESDDPFLMLLTISHEDFPTIRLVNNIVDVVSRGQTYIGFPMNIRLPKDDGESHREVLIDFDNVSLELLDELRSVTTPMDVKIEMALSSNLDTVQLSLEELKLRSVVYDKQKVSAKLYMDSFLNVELSSEKYTPTIYPGMF